MKKLREWLGEKKGNRRFWLMLLSGAAGALLLVVSSLPRGTAKTAQCEDLSLRQTRLEAALEKKAAGLLASVAGVGRVRVAVTLDSLEERVWAEDREDRAGAVSDEHVVVKSGGSESGLQKTVILPRVRGVAVACEGAASAAVRQEVTGLVCAALGVPANRVYVSRMEP